MISRSARLDDARERDKYEALLNEEVFAGIAARRIPGFRRISCCAAARHRVDSSPSWSLTPSHQCANSRQITKLRSCSKARAVLSHYDASRNTTTSGLARSRTP